MVVGCSCHQSRVRERAPVSAFFLPSPAGMMGEWVRVCEEERDSFPHRGCESRPRSAGVSAAPTPAAATDDAVAAARSPLVSAPISAGHIHLILTPSSSEAKRLLPPLLSRVSSSGSSSRRLSSSRESRRPCSGSECDSAARSPDECEGCSCRGRERGKDAL